MSAVSKHLITAEVDRPFKNLFFIFFFFYSM